MSQILSRVRDVDANNSDAVKEALTAFFQNLPKHTGSSSNQWLRVLENVINRFPKYCMAHRNTIEVHLTHYLDSKDFYDVIEAAKSALALQQVRPAQDKAATPKSSWRDQVELLCNTIHSLVGALFGNDICQTGLQNASTTVPLTPLSMALTNLREVSGSSSSQHITAEEKTDMLCTRLRNVFLYLQAMLVEVYPVAKPIRPQQILEAIVRALSSSSAARSLEEIQITAIKTQALRSLDALVVCLGTNLVPFSPLVFRLVMQTLRWTTDNRSDESRKVRCAAYSSLSLWLSTLKCHSIESTQQSISTHEQIVKHVLDDITPYLHVVELKKGGQATKNMSKKAKRKLAKSMLHESNMMASHMPGDKNKLTDSQELEDDLAEAALECAETFLTVCGVFLKPALHKLLQDRLVREGYCLARYSDRRGLCILRALEASRRAAPPAACPKQYCSRLYSLLQTSACREMSMFCTNALMNIRLQLHCAPPSLHFNVAEPADQPSQQETQKVMTERNRAALEALLGPNRVPPPVHPTPSSSTEVITIPDEQEPARKKPRPSDDVTERISLSSQSSVEISDESIPEVQEIVLEIEDTHGGNNKSEQTFEVTRISITRDAEEETAETGESSNSAGNEGESKTIHEASTQLPVNVSAEIDEEVSPRSPEVAYDFPSTGKSKVTLIEKMDDDNLPSTNETDDIQITCGQALKNSQDVSQKLKPEDEAKDIEPKVNGVAEKMDKQLTNGVSELKDNITESTIIVKIADNNGGVTVQDMLADFVDEVNEDVVNVDA